MGSVESEVEAREKWLQVHAANNKRAEVQDWLGEIVPCFDEMVGLIDWSEEQMREHLYEGTILCSILDQLAPEITVGVNDANGSSDQRVTIVKKFLSVLEELGLPGFDIIDLQQGSMSKVVDCLLSVRDYLEISAPRGLRLKGIVDAAEKYHEVLAENKKLFNEVQELKGNIRVYCRIRPYFPGQSAKSTVECVGENSVKIGMKMFKFNAVFGQNSSQAEVFDNIRPLIRSVLDGFNVCIFAYGQTGSGKTYTMSGPETSKEEDKGVNYRALKDLFNISLSRTHVSSYEVKVQMVELYNEQVRDLLSNEATKRLDIRGTRQPDGIMVPGASMHMVKSTTEVLDLMQAGLSNRAVGSTALNECSRRSHSILMVHVTATHVKTHATTHSCLHLIDLAGSERVDKSEAAGDRFREATHINKSLSALSDVIFALVQRNIHVPYRNNNLTKLLQFSLGGQAKTAMLVHVKPDMESYLETKRTLDFAEKVSGIELGAAEINKEVSSLKDTTGEELESEEYRRKIRDSVMSPGPGTSKGFNKQTASKKGRKK